MFETFNVKDAVVWIDPLDGTSDFVKGTLDAVTVLIGLSLCGKSRAGIIHKPFANAHSTDNEDKTNGVTTFATAEHGAFQVNYVKDMPTSEMVTREVSYLKHFE